MRAEYKERSQLRNFTRARIHERLRRGRRFVARHGSHNGLVFEACLWCLVTPVLEDRRRLDIYQGLVCLQAYSPPPRNGGCAPLTSEINRKRLAENFDFELEVQFQVGAVIELGKYFENGHHPRVRGLKDLALRPLLQNLAHKRNHDNEAATIISFQQQVL